MKRCAEYLQGLLHECKSNIERMSERVAESNYQQLHHFISDSEWSAEAVMREAGRKTAAGFESLTGSTGLILDESGNEKAGKKSVGVARQYIGNVGKVCNSQVGVFAVLCRGNRVGLVAGKWHHHIALTMMALHFILETQIQEREALPLLSCADVKLMLARILKNKLDEPDGLAQAIEFRHKQRQSDIVRRLRI